MGRRGPSHAPRGSRDAERCGYAHAGNHTTHRDRAVEPMPGEQSQPQRREHGVARRRTEVAHQGDLQQERIRGRPPEGHRGERETDRSDHEPGHQRAMRPPRESDTHEHQRQRADVEAGLVACRPQRGPVGSSRPSGQLAEQPRQRKLRPVCGRVREGHQISHRARRRAEPRRLVPTEHHLHGGDAGATQQRAEQPRDAHARPPVEDAAPGARGQHEAGRPRGHLEVPECELRSPCQREERQRRGTMPCDGLLGEVQREHEKGQRGVQRLVARVDRLETAERERDRRQRRPPRQQVEPPRIRVGRGRQGEVVEPHRQAVRCRDIERAVEQPIRRVEGRDVALGHEGHTETEPIAPERQRALAQRVRQLDLDRAVENVGITTDRLDADEEPAERQGDREHGCRTW